MRDMRFFAILSLLLTATLTVSAQFKVNVNGKVAACSSNPNFVPRLSVGDNCFFASGSDFSLGISATPLLQDSKKNVAVEGYINPNQSFTSETNIGVLGITKLNQNHGRNYGVLGTINYDYSPNCVGGAGVYATYHGYYLYYPANIQGIYALYAYGSTNLSGRTTAQEIYTPADESLSDNVESVETRDGTSMLENLLKMDVLEFNMKSREKTEVPKDGTEMTDEVKKSYEYMKKDEAEMYSRRHFGLSAQELQKIYPNLVLKGQDNYLYINYTELVPVLIRSIQELKAELDEVKGKNVDAAKSRTATFVDEETTAVGDATRIPAMVTLAQNTPNPFSERTTIRFTLPENAQNAFIYIFDMSGKMQKQIPVTSDMQSVTIEGYELRAGMYIYSLIIGGKEIETKRMILSK